MIQIISLDHVHKEHVNHVHKENNRKTNQKQNKTRQNVTERSQICQTVCNTVVPHKIKNTSKHILQRNASAILHNAIN
jgi:hypothetical protein